MTSRNNIFADARELFIDENRAHDDAARDYILLDGAKTAYAKLCDAIKKPLKIILLYGYPGSGKTAMLRRLYTNLEMNPKRKMYYAMPTFLEKDELTRIFRLNSRKKIPLEPTFFELQTLFQQSFTDEQFLILLDEAQLYSDEQMEYIRLLADTRIFKFVVALHKIDDEDLIAKAHFQSRIWENIELSPLSTEELRFFIERKLLDSGLNQAVSMFRPKTYRLIHRFTEGNIRESMKFMYKLFDFYDFLQDAKPSAVDFSAFSQKYIEMVALEGGFIHV